MLTKEQMPGCPRRKKRYEAPKVVDYGTALAITREGSGEACEEGQYEYDCSCQE